MKRILCLLLVMLVLAGCGNAVTDSTEGTTGVTAGDAEIIVESGEIAFESRFDDETVITLSDEGVKAEGVNAMGVYSDNDIVYYEDRDSYHSGNPYGEGELHERHSADEAAGHTVVHITKPGAYRVSGRLSAGQIAVDLGEDAYEDSNAVVELILDGADITCTVAPAIVFYNVYECDGAWSTDTAKAEVDTSKAGANLILAGGSENFANGSHVARIYKDKEGEKKLWKIDGAVYSFMSMNVYGPGALEITADNEGLNSELHLTINGGDIAIRSGNDGINTNEDGVSVTTINGGSLHNRRTGRRRRRHRLQRLSGHQRRYCRVVGESGGGCGPGLGSGLLHQRRYSGCAWFFHGLGGERFRAGDHESAVCTVL